jgi:hypothetical protein
MTKSALDEFGCIVENQLCIPFAPSHSLFKNNAPYKLFLKYDCHGIYIGPEKHKHSHPVGTKTKIHKFMDGQAADKSSTISYATWRRTAIHVHDEKAALEICWKFKEDIVKVAGPATKDHLNQITNKSIKYRSMLFYNKFKYVVRAAGSFGDEREWRGFLVSNNFDPCCNTDVRMDSCSGSTFAFRRIYDKRWSVFTNDPELVVLLKMRYSHQITSCEEAILLT